MRYSLSAFYKDYIKEKILKDSLKNGKIPNQNEMDEALTSIYKTTDEFRNPLLATVPFFILNGETSSAKKTNETFNAIESDLSICVTAVIDQEDKISSLYDSSFSKMAGLQNKVSLLKEEVDKVLFESKNTDNHEELFYEKFNTSDMVDQAFSTVTIGTKEVTLKTTEQSPIDLSTAVDSIVIIAENNPKIINSVDIGSMTVNNIVKNNNKVWMHQLSSTEALASARIDLIIRIPSLSTEINKILFEPYSVDLKTQVNIEISYSKDGLNWLYPDGEYKKRFDQATSFSFAGCKDEYWRIRFTKFGNDGFFSNFYVYNYGLKSINFYGKTYDKISRLDLGYFYSKPILFNNNVKFANVKICETVPTETSIKYSLAPIYESELADVNDGSITPEELYYYPLANKDVDSQTIDFLNSSETPIVDGILISQVFDYKDRNENDYCLNNELPVDFVKSQTILLRGALNQSLFTTTGKEYNTNNGQFSGWNFNGTHYSTYVLIEDHNGLEIDLGSTQMFVNNIGVQGKIVLKKGINNIVTHRDNWKSLDLTTLPLESDEAVDLLHHYNHKYLIEGIGEDLYGRDTSTIIDDIALVDIIDDTNAYSRYPKACWSTKMKELDFETFTLKTKNELDVFSYKIDNTNQERIVVKSNPDLGLINDETFSIITKLHSAENIKGLIFKAVLETTNNKVSPVLTEYLVKIK
jgi:hypothetical protein